MAATATARLQKELREVSKNPNPGLRALPSPSNLLEWHYVLEGDKDTEYAGGYYHGKIIFPPTYPFKPPAIIMLTPSGRFDPGAKICLSISDFHPESWNPLWGVSMILLGLQSFFYETASTTGALHNVSAAEKRRLASQSLEFNAKNMTYRKLFPDLVQLAKERGIEKAEAEAAATGIQGKNSASEGNGATIAASNGVAQQQQGEGAAGVGSNRGRERAKPILGAREIFLGAAALFVAVGVAFVALEASCCAVPIPVPIPVPSPTPTPTPTPSGGGGGSTTTAPGVPTSTVNTGTIGTINAAWTAPASTGGATVTYDILCTADTGPSATATAIVATSYALTGLTSGVTYSCSVRATNSAGSSAYSTAVNCLVIPTVPNAPTIGTFTGNTGTSGAVNAAWTAPAFNGGTDITSYSLLCTPNTGSAVSATGIFLSSPVCTGSVCSTVMTGLAVSGTYTCKALAVNSVGSSVYSASSNSFTVPIIPGAVWTQQNAPSSSNWIAVT